jgi:hypothetical protein
VVVISPNEFWLNLHRLAEAYDAEGQTPQQRAENIVAQFRDMPLVAQREVLAELVNITLHIPEVYRQVMVAATGPAQPKKPDIIDGAA